MEILGTAVITGMALGAMVQWRTGRTGAAWGLLAFVLFWPLYLLIPAVMALDSEGLLMAAALFSFAIVAAIVQSLPTLRRD